jgi:hypothetical protein
LLVRGGQDRRNGQDGQQRIPAHQGDEALHTENRTPDTSICALLSSMVWGDRP